MHNGVFASLQRLKRLTDDMLPRLCQHLYGDVIGNQIFLNQPAEKNVFRLGSGRETHLDFLKASLAEQLKKLDFCIQIHGNYQRLIAVSQIHTAPDRGVIDGILLYPVIAGNRRHKILFLILFVIHHDFFLHFFFCGDVRKKPYISCLFCKRRKADSSYAVPLFFTEKSVHSSDTAVSGRYPFPCNGGIPSASTVIS